MFSQEHATTMIDMEARQLTGMLKKKSKTLRGWFNAMSEENHVVALFNPESYRREVFTKRSVFLLVEVLSFLFVACVYAPGDFGEEPAYLCPGESTSGPGGGGLIQFPRFDDGHDVVSFASWVVFNAFYDAMVNTFWLWPAGLLLWALYVVGGNIHRTRELHAARLLELTRPEEVMTPFEIDDATEVRVAKNMLHAAQLVLQRLTNAIRWRKQYLDLPPRLKRFLDVWLGLTIPQHRRLEAQVATINANIQMIGDAMDLTKERIKGLDDAEHAKAMRNRSKCPRFLPACLKWWWSSRQKKKGIQARKLAAAKASLPYEIQLSVLRREAMIDKINGNTLLVFVVIWKMPWFLRGAARRLKVACFEWYSGIDDEGEGTKELIQDMLKTKEKAMYLGGAYLVFVTLYIFLTAIRLEDNEVVRMVLLTTLVSEGMNAVVMQPLELLLFAGFLPAVAVSLVIYDMKRFFRDETRDALRMRRRGATPKVVNEEARFELSPQWSKIEAEVAFDAAGGRNKEPWQQQSVRGVERVPTSPRRAMVETSSWSISANLHRKGVRSLRELRNRKVVTKEVLARDIHLSDEQVAAFWRIIHPEDRVEIPVEKPTTVLRKVAQFFMGSTSAADQQSSLRKPANPAAVFPVLSGPSEWDEKDDEDEGMDAQVPQEQAAVHSALTAFKRRLIRTAPPGPFEESKGSHPDEDEKSATEDVHVDAAAPIVNDEEVPSSASMRQWLDDIQQGYGALYAPMFTSLGANTVDEMRSLSKSQLRGIVGQLTSDDDARRAIRAALRGHLRSPPPAPENEGVVATATEENDGPGAAQAQEAAVPEAEQSQQPEQEELPNNTNAETTAEGEPDLSIEQWLDSLEHGWGSRYSFVFTDRGFSTLSRLHSIRRGDLQEVQVAMRASGMDQASRRVLRSALRSLLG